MFQRYQLSHNDAMRVVEKIRAEVGASVIG